MTADSYKTALKEAKRELFDLAQERDKINARISQVQGVITSLAGMLNDPGEALEEVAEAQAILGPSGLTDAIRGILRSDPRKTWTPVEVRNLLATANFPLGEYSNALSAIHTVLKRLAKSPENVAEKVGDGYRWVGTISYGAPNSLANQFARARENLTPRTGHKGFGQRLVEAHNKSQDKKK
ncbi:MAG TPA: hypothetical protein VNX88_20850 [Terriglobales bacterium]|nr:hypothetical protein [Terriglobales bacterium]